VSCKPCCADSKFFELRAAGLLTEGLGGVSGGVRNTERLGSSLATGKATLGSPPHRHDGMHGLLELCAGPHGLVQLAGDGVFAASGRRDEWWC
jgi:hypothetical protein